MRGYIRVETAISLVAMGSRSLPCPRRLGLAARLAVPAGAVGIGIRAVGEERMLRQELPGYEEYTRHVRFSMVPGLW
jgi:protein-S-isoprenylcysteine O-methyltransferase Ste14